jgi:hypothetical protein
VLDAASLLETTCKSQMPWFATCVELVASWQAVSIGPEIVHDRKVGSRWYRSVMVYFWASPGGFVDVT